MIVYKWLIISWLHTDSNKSDLIIIQAKHISELLTQCFSESLLDVNCELN